MTTQMDEFERLLEESFKSKLSVADVVRGQLVKKKTTDTSLISVLNQKVSFLTEKFRHQWLMI